MFTTPIFNAALILVPIAVIVVTLLLEISDRHMIRDEHRTRLEWARERLEAEGLTNPSQQLCADEAERIKAQCLEAGYGLLIWRPRRYRDEMAAKPGNVGLNTIHWKDTGNHD